MTASPSHNMFTLLLINFSLCHWIILDYLELSWIIKNSAVHEFNQSFSRQIFLNFLIKFFLSTMELLSSFISVVSVLCSMINLQMFSIYSAPMTCFCLLLALVFFYISVFVLCYCHQIHRLLAYVKLKKPASSSFILYPPSIFRTYFLYYIPIYYIFTTKP